MVKLSHLKWKSSLGFYGLSPFCFDGIFVEFLGPFCGHKFYKIISSKSRKSTLVQRGAKSQGNTEDRRPYRREEF